MRALVGRSLKFKCSSIYYERNMRPLIYYIATTLDGFIAHEDGSFDGFNWDESFMKVLFAEFPETLPAHFRGPATREENRMFDAVLMGRKTYDVGLKEGFTNPYPTLDQYVFSRTMEASPDPAVKLVKSDPVPFVNQLKQEEGKAIWLCGGSEFAGVLLEAGLIDELIIKLNPVVFGTGMPLFATNKHITPLTLRSSKSYESGHQILHFAV